MDKDLGGALDSLIKFRVDQQVKPLEKRVAALEEKVELAPGEPCPCCDQRIPSKRRYIDKYDAYYLMKEQNKE